MLLSTNRPVFKEISPTTTLRLLWNPTIDKFQVKNNTTQVQQTNFTASTKRKVLATTASIFDPHGLLSPAVIAYKIFLQKVWQDKLLCDEVLPANLKQEWNQLLQNIPKLSQLKINRKFICFNAVNTQIHGFCDSSEQAYGACLHMRSQTITTRHLANFYVPNPRWQH